jgi:hypothetical protein
MGEADAGQAADAVRGIVALSGGRGTADSGTGTMLTKGLLLALCALCGLVAAAALLDGIRALIRLNADSDIAVLPVLAEQPVFLSSAGEVLLAVRTKLGGARFGGVSFALRYAGGAVAGRPVVMRTRRTDLSGTVTLVVHRFTLPQPGEFVLSANGLAAARDYSDARLVLVRPNGGTVLLRILQVLAAAAVLIGSLVVIGLALIGRIGG